MRTLILIAMTILPFSAEAKNVNLSPDTFVGDFDLVEARYGMLCDQHMQGLLSHSINKHDDSFVQIDLGAFPFPAVNLGPQTFDDALSTSVSEAFTTDDSLVFRSRDVSKSDGEVTTSKTVATLHGDTLHLVSESHYAPPGGSCNSTYFECVYRRAAPRK